MARNEKTRFSRVLTIVVALPAFQFAGCLSDAEIRAFVGDVVAASLDVTEVAINNWIDQSLLN